MLRENSEKTIYRLSLFKVSYFTLYAIVIEMNYLIDEIFLGKIEDIPRHWL